MHEECHILLDVKDAWCMKSATSCQMRKIVCFFQMGIITWNGIVGVCMNEIEVDDENHEGGSAEFQHFVCVSVSVPVLYSSKSFQRHYSRKILCCR